MGESETGSVMPAKVNAEKCDGCATCVETCPVTVIEIVDKLAVVNEADCIDCNACADECPTQAMTMAA